MRKFLLIFLPMLFCVFAINAQNFNVEETAAISVVSANQAKLGLTANDMNNVKVSSSYVDNTSGVRYVYLVQTFRGIPVYNQMLVLSFRGDQLLSKAGAFNKGIEKQANVNTGMPAVSAESAVQAALSNRGLRAWQTAIAISRNDEGRKVEFGNMGVSRENITAQLMWTPIENSKEVRLSWHVYIIPTTTPDYWMVRVDAVNSSILGMDNYTDYDNWGTPDVHGLVKYPQFAYGISSTVNNNLFDFKKSEDPSVITTASYRVVPYPGEAPSFPNGAHALRTDPWLAGSANATTLKWHGITGTDYAYSRGNNVWAYEDRANNNTASVAKSASSTTALPSLTFDFTPNYTVDPTQTTPVPNQQYNITNLFYWNNIIHDVLYAYGFDEVGGNFQADNLGRGGLGNDNVLAEAQDGGGTNNANFSTPADGGSGRMQMYLWTGGTPNRDGDVDNGIIVHEFGHGLSNRLTGGPSTGGCLGNAEQMGEGWSDYYGLMFTQDWATATLTTGFTTPRGIGTYALFQAPTGLGIRTQRYCTDFTINNKVYLASLPAGPHPRGEIWCATLWDMTWNIINQVGVINPNLYNLAGGGGNNIAMKLVTEGLKLQQCSPGFISGRDAILQADRNLYAGLYSCAIWEAFRRRGMGAFASEGSTASVTDQIPDFSQPTTLGATVSATTIPEGSNLTYINSVTTCATVSGFTLRDTLPANVTYVSGGVYDAPNRVVSFAVSQGAGTTNYPFIVNVNNGSYFAPVTLLNETVAAATIPASWTTTAPLGSPWVVTNTQSNSAPNSFFAVNLPADGDERLETTSTIALPLNAYNKLSFWHRFNTEDGWDGGVVEISTNGGTTWIDLGPYMTTGAYNGGLGVGPNNPIGGRPAFTGLTPGTAFMNTIVNLSSFGGQSIKIRFRFGSDNNTTAPTAPAGWWVDDIKIEAIAAVQMRTSLFNASNTRVSLKDMITEITQVVACAPTINQQPVDQSACVGNSVSYTCVGAATGGVTYQWQISTTGIGGAYTNLANGAPYSGVTTTTLTVNPTTVGMNGYYYRCIVTGTCAPNATSNPARLSVAAGSTAGTVTPANSNVCGTTNSGTLTVAGFNGSVVRWESATNIAGPWTAIANTTTTYTFSNITQTMYYRAVTQFATCAAANSSIATVTFAASLPMQILADPGTTICAGDPTRLTVMEGNLTNANPASPTAGGNGQALIAFNITNSNAFPVTFTSITSRCLNTGPMNARIFFKTTPIAGAPGAISVANGWNQFGAGASTSTAGAVHTLLSGLTLIVPAGTTYGIALEGLTATNAANIAYTNGGAIVTYTDGGCTITTGGNVGYGGAAAPAAPGFNPRNFNGTVTLVGGALTPVTTGTFLWSPAAGLSSTTTNPVAASPMVTTTYTVNHDNGAGCVRQANITITVNERPRVTAHPVSTAACNTTTASFTVAGVGTALTYQWQVSTTGVGGPYVNIPAGAPYTGETTATLTINPVASSMNGYAYRCVLSGVCSPAIPPMNVSNGAVLTVNPLPNVTVTPTSGCGGVAGTNGLLLTASGANTYTWAPLTGLFTNAIATIPYTGGNSATVYAAPTTYTEYTVTGTVTATGCVNTAIAKINYTPPAPTVTPSSVTMCLGDAAVRLISSSSQTFTTSFSSGTVNILIPDGPAIPPVPTSYPATSSNITVSGIPAGATIANVRARFNITHAYVSDMVIALKAPNGQIINLSALLNRTNNPGANFTNTVISSAGTALQSAGTAPYTGTFKADLAGATFTAFGFTFPGGPTGYVPTSTVWSSLYSTANGVWSVGMYDAGAPDGGTLNNWSIDIDYVVGVPSTPATWTPIAGLYNDALATIPYAGTARDTVWTMPTPSGVYNYQATVKSLDPSGSLVLPPQAATFTGNVRGYWFTAPSAFVMTALQVPTDASAGNQSISVVRFTGATPPPAFPGTTNAFTTLFLTQNNPTAGSIPVNIPIAAGDVIGILGYRGTTNSYAANGPQTVVINGANVVLTRMGMQFPLTTTAPQQLWQEAAFGISRVGFDYGLGLPQCTSPARNVVVTVNQPTTITAQSGNQTICTDKVATFSVTAAGTGPFVYVWQVSTNGGTTWTTVANGGVYSGATTSTLTITNPPVTMSGYLYRAIITGAAPCAAATSASRMLTVNPLPIVVITVSPYTALFPGLRTTLSSNVTPNPAASYTWLRDGVVVAGANGPTLERDIDGLGAYRLRVNDVNGCTSISNEIVIRDSVSANCFLYPNPTGGKFEVRYHSVANNVLPRYLTVYDAKGQRVYSKIYQVGRPYDRMEVDMRNESKGVYTVEIGDRNGSRLAICRVVIQ